MQTVIKFNLPEEKPEFNSAINGSLFQSVLFELANHHIRGFLKHGHEFKTIEGALEWVREYIYNEVGDKLEE